MAMFVLRVGLITFQSITTRKSYTVFEKQYLKIRTIYNRHEAIIVSSQ